MVGRLIQNQYIGLCCKSAGNLHALLLARRERLIAPEPVVLYRKRAAHLLCQRAPVAGKVGKICWLGSGSLRTEGRHKAPGHRSFIRLELAGNDAGKRCLAAAIGTDNGMPAK